MYRKSLNIYMFYLFFLALLFNKFILISAGIININRENDLRDSDFKECSICYDEDIFKLLNDNCDGITTISDLDEMTNNDLLCLCNISENNSTIENCQKCAGLDMDEFKQMCTEIKQIETMESSNVINQNVTNVYASDESSSNLNKYSNKSNNDEKTVESKTYKPIILYSLIGSGFIIILGTGFFIGKRIMRTSSINNSEEIQMDSLEDLENLRDININGSYYNKSPIMPMDQLLTNNKVSNSHNNNQLSYQGYASTSSSEPKLNNKDKYIDDGSNINYRYPTSEPNIPKGILINKTRRSSLGISSDNLNDELSDSKTSKPAKNLRVTFSKGLTTMHEFMSREWNKAIECEGLKKESIIDLGWRNGTVIHNFNPTKEDEIKLRIGDNVIIRLAFDDGWAYAFNRNTGVVGMIPIICVKFGKVLKN